MLNVVVAKDGKVIREFKAVRVYSKFVSGKPMMIVMSAGFSHGYDITEYEISIKPMN